MDTLIYDNFFEISKNLAPPDLLSLCSTNRQYHDFCQRPNFYHDLILAKHNLNITNATYKDYRFIDELNSIKLTVPTKSFYEEDEEAVKKTQELLDYCIVTELNAYLNRQPIRYFTYSQKLLLEKRNSALIPLFRGVWFSAYTVEGAILKVKDIHPSSKTREGGGDLFFYLSQRTYHGHVKFPSLISPSWLGLVETRRPYLDQDPDKSKLNQGYNKVLDYKSLVSKKGRNLRIESLAYAYRNRELGDRSMEVKYFTISPFRLDQDWGSNIKEFEPFSGLVIESQTPEGAILRLANLIPAFIRLLIEEFKTPVDNDKIIYRLVLFKEKIRDLSDPEPYLVLTDRPIVN